MGALFRIETDRVVLTWSKGRGDEPSLVAGRFSAPAGWLLITKRRSSLVFQNTTSRTAVPPAVAKNAELTAGPRLYEQTNYNLYARATTDESISITHRDPAICRNLSHEEGKVIHGYVNFGSQVGRSQFSVFVNGSPEFDFEVEVFPTKLDYCSDYEQMLAEVQDILAGLAVEYLRATYRLGISAPAPTPTQLEWLILLRHVADDLERSLLYIAHHPFRELSRESVHTRVERVRRVDSQMRSAIRRSIASRPQISTDAGILFSGRVEERRARSTLDTPEHRWLSIQLQHISRKLSLLRKEELANKDQSERRKKTVKELDEIYSRIARLRALEPFASACGPPPAGFASPRLLAAPGYRSAYRSCLILLLGLRLDGGPFRLSVKDLSQLYEYWCYLAVVRIVAEELNARAPAGGFFRVIQEGLHVRLEQGRENAVEFDTSCGRKVTITYNARFQGNCVLIPQKPDILITLTDAHWPKLQLVLDAKYRIDASPEYRRRYGSPGPPEDALNVLHRYRDAILSADGGETQIERPKRVVIQAVAMFPYHEASPDEFRNSLLWRSLDRIGVGGIPMLPGETDYLRQWLRTALRLGGWAISDRVTAHQVQDRAFDWRLKAAEPVLMAVLRADNPADHLTWIAQQRRYYLPLSKTQRRQFSTKFVTIYSPSQLRTPGAVTHRATVLDIDVLPRGDIQTPWPMRRSKDEMQVLYRLGELETLVQPIENTDETGRGHRVSTHRWSSFLALQRAKVLQELFLETEPEWRLYENLRSARIDFVLRPGKAHVADPTDPAGRTWLINKNGEFRVRYAGAAGFLIRLANGKEHWPATPEDVIAVLMTTR